MIPSYWHLGNKQGNGMIFAQEVLLQAAAKVSFIPSRMYLSAELATSANDHFFN